MDPAAVFATLAALGGTAPRTVVVGCEVENVDEGMGLTAAVTAAVPDAITATEDVLSRFGTREATSAREG
jgi:hydrogenase maturation protease